MTTFMIEKNQPDNIDISNQRCAAIGNIVTCLYYLSKEAGRSDLPQLADVIDRAIGSAVFLGQEALCR